MGKTLEEIIKSRPDKRVNGGASCVWKLKHLYAICDKLKPSLIIESGSFTGNSLWLFKQQNPDSELHSYEINYAGLNWRDKSIGYHNYDIQRDIDKYSPKANDLIYFDDHINQEKRLKWAYKVGFKHVMFDDNVPTDKLHHFGMPATPTISMLDEAGKIPDYVESFEILPYDGSNPEGRNGGENYLTYLKIK